MKLKFSLLLILLFIVGCARDTSPLYLLEDEHFYIYLEDNIIKRKVFSETLGVGIESSRGERKKFNVTLKDKIPKDSLILKPVESYVTTRTIYGKQFKVPFSLSKNGHQELEFIIEKAPALDMSSGSCCTVPGCPPSCGYCAVGFSYLVTAEEIEPFEWANLDFRGTPRSLKVHKENQVEIELNVENKTLKEPGINFRIPNRIRNANIRLKEYPPSMRKTDKGSYIVLYKPLKDKKEKIRITLIIIPNQKGELSLQNLIDVSGHLESLVYPEVTPVTTREVKKTNYSVVSFKGDLSFIVE